VKLIQRQKEDLHQRFERKGKKKALEERGEITHFISIREDVTDRKRLLKELIDAKEKAEESDKLKTAFINNISHEIRTPLNGILGFGEMLMHEENPDVKEEMLKMVHQSSARLLQTVTDYLDIAMIVSGSLKVNQGEFLLGEFFEEVVAKALKRFKSGNQVAFKVEMEDSLKKVLIHSYRELLRKSMMKLIDNAFKFTKEGEVCVRVENEERHCFLKFQIRESEFQRQNKRPYLTFSIKKIHRSREDTKEVDSGWRL
jgi:signal transduction histidine kinase